jgi:hypothetical protein
MPQDDQLAAAKIAADAQAIIGIAREMRRTPGECLDKLVELGEMTSHHAQLIKVALAGMR